MGDSVCRKKTPCCDTVRTTLLSLDLVARVMASAGIPVSKEPQGLSRSDGKRPDGLSLIPWQAGKPLTWDVTVVCPLDDSCVAVAARGAGSVIRAGSSSEDRQMDTPTFDTRYSFQSVAVETTVLANFYSTGVARFLCSQMMIERAQGSFLMQ